MHTRSTCRACARVAYSRGFIVLRCSLVRYTDTRFYRLSAAGVICRIGSTATKCFLILAKSLPLGRGYIVFRCARSRTWLLLLRLLSLPPLAVVLRLSYRKPVQGSGVGLLGSSACVPWVVSVAIGCIVRPLSPFPRSVGFRIGTNSGVSSESRCKITAFISSMQICRVATFRHLSPPLAGGKIGLFLPRLPPFT